MKLTDEDCRTLLGFLAWADNSKDKKALLQMWFDEKSAKVYKEGWKDACEEYDIADTVDWDDEVKYDVEGDDGEF